MPQGMPKISPSLRDRPMKNPNPSLRGLLPSDCLLSVRLCLTAPAQAQDLPCAVALR